MTVQQITSKAQFDELLDSGKVVLVDFYADWCGPCKMISPVFDQLANEKTTDEVGFYKVDIDNLPDVAQEVGIRSIPAFHAYKKNTCIDKVVGANRAGLNALVQKVSV